MSSVPASLLAVQLPVFVGIAAACPFPGIAAFACFFKHCICLFLQALQLDFYGDAVVEAWRGTQHGEPHSRCQDAPDIFDAHFGREFESHAWGVAGPLVSCMHCSCKASLKMNTAMKAGRTDSSCAACLLTLHCSKHSYIL